MKWRLLLVFLFTGVCAFSFDYGVLDDYVENATPGNVNSRYLMKPILEGRPIRVLLSGLPEGDIEEEGRYLYQLENMYMKWLSQAAKAIRKDKREAEFADILPLLEQGVTLEQVSCLEEPHDIQFNFRDTIKEIQLICGPATAGCYMREHNPPIIFVKRQLTPTQKLRILHEIGHSLGLGDQYKPRNDNMGRNNSSFVYSTPQSQPSIMDSLSLKGFQCGDVDGIINLIDITRGQFHGGQEGWHSFCKKKPRYHYVQGKAELKPYEIWELDDDIMQLVIHAPSGESTLYNLPISQQPALPLDTVFTPQETDKQGRVLRATGNHGETKYCMYSYEKRMCVVEKEGTWMQAEIRYNTQRVNRFRVVKDQFLMKIVKMAAGGQVSLAVIRPFNKNERRVEFLTFSEQAEIVVAMQGEKKKITMEDALHPIGQRGQVYRFSQEIKRKRKELSKEELVEIEVRKAKWENWKKQLVELAFENNRIANKGH